MTQPVPKRADQLVAGDRIPNEQTAFPFNKGEALVVFVANETDEPDPHTFVAYRYPNGRHDSMTVRSESELQVYPADTGLGYSRADDGETTQPIAGRVQPHFGAVVNEVGGPQELLAIAPGADGGVAFALAPSGAVTDPVARARAVELTEAVAANRPARVFACAAHGVHPHLGDGGDPMVCLDCPQCRPPGSTV